MSLTESRNKNREIILTWSKSVERCECSPMNCTWTNIGRKNNRQTEGISDLEEQLTKDTVVGKG